MGIRVQRLMRKPEAAWDENGDEEILDNIQCDRIATRRIKS